MILILIALGVGIVIGATEANRIIAAVDRAAGELHTRIAELEAKVAGAPEVHPVTAQSRQK